MYETKVSFRKELLYDNVNTKNYYIEKKILSVSQSISCLYYHC